MVLGIDIGGTRIKAAVVTEAGKTIRSAEALTAAQPEAFGASLNNMLRVLQQDLPPVESAGIGCKGIIDSHSTKVLTLPGALHHLEGQRLSTIIAPVLPANCPVIADNDARIAMAGEKQWGAARSCQDAIMLTLGTGVGGAVMLDGEILRGKGAIAGHIGHLTVDPDGPECICGNHGCLETYFSALAIESEAATALHRGLITQLSKPTCEDVFTAARNGDQVALRIVHRATKYLAGAIAGLLFVLDPEKVILTGQITEAGALLFDLVRKDVHERTLPLLRRTVPIVKSELSDPSGTLGAAAIALTLLNGNKF
jgi:glucokinase